MRITTSFWSFSLLILLSFRVFGNEFQVEKIEPPNWWTGMRWRNVQLFVTGENLNGVVATSVDNNLRITATHNADDPHYLFIEMTLAPNIPSGEYAIKLTKEGRTIDVRFPVRKRQRNANHHQGFDNRDVVYLIVPDRFSDGDPANNVAVEVLPEYDRSRPEMRHGGDIRGIIKRLDYLKELGITALWLTPVLENKGINSYHGYKTTDHYRIDPRFGTNEDYRNLVQAAHQRGLKVIFDHVSNHVGIRHPWLEKRPTREWINGTIESHESNKHYLLSVSDPHASADSVRLLKEFWFVDRMPDLNQRDPFLAKYLIQNSLWWIEFSGIDGIREDTYPYADQDFLASWAKAIFDEYPSFNIVGEIWATKPAVISQFQQGSILQRKRKTHLPSVMDFPLMQSLRDFVTGKGKLRDVHDVLAQDFLYANPDQLMVFMENHDSTRGAFLTDDFRRVKSALGIVLTSRGIPQLLYGSEIGMKGGARHVDLRAEFPGGFPNDERNAFTFKGRTKDENEIFDFVSRLLRLRREYPAIASGKMIHFQPHWNQDVYKYLKILGDQTILIIVNGEERSCDVDVSELSSYFQSGSKFKDLFGGKTTPWDPSRKIAVGPMQFALFLLDGDSGR